VLDEIKMIKAVLTEQLKVLNTTCYDKFIPEALSTRGAFSEAKELLDGTMHNFDVMENHASAVERGVSRGTPCIKRCAV